jgi:peptidyl-prolyl cis-trans isomerase B (cyclophilin B)
LDNKPLVTIEMANGMEIQAVLEPETAPESVRNFIHLIRQGFYDGLIFHRVIPGFMIQGGCPEGSGMGGPGYRIKGEFTKNGHPNKLKHTAGVLSMARAMDPNSAGSQFFITVADAHFLDGDYAAFGKVIKGIDVANAIVTTPTDTNDRPRIPQTIKKITVDTFGADYDPPEKLPDI